MLLLERGKHGCFVKWQTLQTLLELKGKFKIVLDSNWSGWMEGCPKCLCQKLNMLWTYIGHVGLDS